MNWKSGGCWPPLFPLRDIEYNEVLVVVGKVPSLALVEVVGELSLAVVLGLHAAVLIADTEGLAVEHDTEDTGSLHGVTGTGLQMDLAGVREIIISAGALPEGNSFGVGQLQVLGVEVVGGVIEIDTGGLPELRQHDHMKQIRRSEPLLAADVEEHAHFLEPIDIQTHNEGSVPEEPFVINGLIGGERLIELGVVQVQEIDSTHTALAAVGATGIEVMERIRGHAVDGAHDKSIVLDGHGLLHFVEDHGDERIELSGTGEGALELTIENGLVQLKSHQPIIELGVRRGRMIDKRIIGRTIGQLPAFVDSGLGKLAPNLHQNGTVLPGVHHDGWGGTGVGPIHKDSATDPVHQGVDELVLPAVDVLNTGTD